MSTSAFGIVGLGKLGTRVAKVGLAFGMDVVAWSQNLTDERAAEVGVRRVEKDELFATADVVTIHLLLSKRTRGLIGAGIATVLLCARLGSASPVEVDVSPLEGHDLARLDAVSARPARRGERVAVGSRGDRAAPASPAVLT